VTLSSPVESSGGVTAPPRVLSFTTEALEWQSACESLDYMDAVYHGDTKVAHTSLNMVPAVREISPPFRGYVRTAEIFCPTLPLFALKLRITRRVSLKPPFDVVTEITGMEIRLAPAIL